MKASSSHSKNRSATSDVSPELSGTVSGRGKLSKVTDKRSVIIEKQDVEESGSDSGRAAIDTE